MDQPNTAPNVDPPHPVASTPPPPSQPTWNDSLSQMDTYAEKLRVMLPQAPPGLLDGYMKFAPWIAIVFGALAPLAAQTDYAKKIENWPPSGPIQKRSSPP